MATTEIRASQPKVGHLAPEPGLSALIQVNTDMDFATVAVRGSLTESNCAELIRMVVSTSYVDSELRITVDLSGARSVDREALKMLAKYPTWTVIGPSTDIATDGGPPNLEAIRPDVGSAGHASHLTSPESIAENQSATDSPEGEADKRVHPRPAAVSRLTPEGNTRPHPETSTRLGKLTEKLDRRDNSHLSSTPQRSGSTLLEPYGQSGSKNLSERQAVIAVMFANNLTCEDIATRLSLSVQSVREHLSRVLEILDLSYIEDLTYVIVAAHFNHDAPTGRTKTEATAWEPGPSWY